MPRGMRGQGRKGGARSRPGGVTNNQLAMSQRAPKMQVFRFRRVVQEVLSGSVTGIVGYTPLVTLGKFPSNAEFLALFTQYRLAKLTVLFAPAQDGANFAFPYPKVNTVFDYTTLAALGSVTEAQQFQSWKQTVFNISRTQAKITTRLASLRPVLIHSSGLRVRFYQSTRGSTLLTPPRCTSGSARFGRIFLPPSQLQLPSSVTGNSRV